MSHQKKALALACLLLVFSCAHYFQAPATQANIYLTIITDNCALDATNNNYYYIKRLLLFHKGQYAMFVSVCSDQAIYERFLTKNTLFNHYFNLEKLLDIIV